MGFVFSLEAVLTVRLRAEERAERELGEAVRLLVEAKASLARTEAEMLEVADRVSAELRASCSAAQMQMGYAHLSELQGARVRGLDRIAEMEGLRAKCLESYQMARRDHEMVAHLKQSERRSFETAQRRREQATLDEIFLGRRPRH